MRVVDWLFRDRRSGRIVVAQWPNIPLVVWFVAGAARSVLDLSGGWAAAARAISVIALTWWAADEIARGVNPWRRALGTVVLAGLLVSLLRQ